MAPPEPMTDVGYREPLTSRDQQQTAASGSLSYSPWFRPERSPQRGNIQRCRSKRQNPPGMIELLTWLAMETKHVNTQNFVSLRIGVCLTYLQEWGGVELNFVIWALLEFRDPLVFDPLEETNLCQADEDPSQQCPFSEGFYHQRVVCTE